jgi:hypothetical protein
MDQRIPQRGPCRRSPIYFGLEDRTQAECHICEKEIEPGDVAVCGGCDNPTCPECMGDDGICQDCELEE